MVLKRMKMMTSRLNVMTCLMMMLLSFPTPARMKCVFACPEGVYMSDIHLRMSD